MPMIPFTREFAKPIYTGQKRQTVRPLGKIRFQVGQPLYLYEGYRYHIGTYKCINARKINLLEKCVILEVERDLFLDENDEFISGQSLDIFAQADGFGNWNEMRNWFKKQYGGLPFNGWLIEW